MRLVPTSVVSQLTGLSTDTLREWTRRRGLVYADIAPKQKGSPAKFSWQTILVLRIAVQLRDNFHIELEAYKKAFLNLQHTLQRISFIELWGKVLILSSNGNWELTRTPSLKADSGLLILELDPHLNVLKAGLSLANDDMIREQLDLFSLPNLHREHENNYPFGVYRIKHTR